MRNDNLPFDSDSVDNIYCSHVIEHIETEHVAHFIQESFRALKKGGHLRIVCPDSLFLVKQLTHNPDYFSWHPLFTAAEDAILCFVNEAASHKLGAKNSGIEGNPLELDFQALTDLLRKGGRFESSSPQRDINNWCFSRIEAIGRDIGFAKILEGKNKGASSPLMQGHDMDLTHPEMSLYVDLIK